MALQGKRGEDVHSQHDSLFTVFVVVVVVVAIRVL